jgi:hypothetical protein
MVVTMAGYLSEQLAALAIPVLGVQALQLCVLANDLDLPGVLLGVRRHLLEEQRQARVVEHPELGKHRHLANATRVDPATIM